MVKNIFKKIFRYKLVSIYFIISQLIILMSVFGVLQIYNKAYAKENDRLKSIAKNRIELDVTTMGNKDLLSSIGNNVVTGNIVAENLSVEFTERGSSNKCEVLLVVNEELPYPLVEGHIPGAYDEDYGRNVVALGRDKYNNAYEKNGKKYVTLAQEEYEVVGVIGSNYSDYWDYNIVFNIKCMGEKTKNALCTNNEQIITLYSNNYDLNDSYKNAYQNIVDVDKLSNIVAYNKADSGQSSIKQTLGREQLKTNIIVYVFCLLNSIIISMFWIIQRKKELIIKRIFGYGNVRLLLDILKENLILMCISLIIYMFIYFIFNFKKYINGEIIIYSNSTMILSVVVLFFITLIITMIYPVIIIYNKSERLIR